jgi:hypothetical protein
MLSTPHESTRWEQRRSGLSPDTRCDPEAEDQTFCVQVLANKAQCGNEKGCRSTLRFFERIGHGQAQHKEEVTLAQLIDWEKASIDGFSCHDIRKYLLANDGPHEHRDYFNKIKEKRCGKHIIFRAIDHVLGRLPTVPHPKLTLTVSSLLVGSVVVVQHITTFFANLTTIISNLLPDFFGGVK